MTEELIEEKEENRLIPNEENKAKKEFTILGFTIWRLLAYFIVYSILGYVVETLFGLAKYGTLESRQSFLYGPFCSIYGLGADVIILILQYFKKNYNTLFLGGCLVGSVLEYVVSWTGEVILHVKWWDYSNMPLNLNGRICLLYSLFWGFLSLYLMISLNPKIDKLANWLRKKINIKVIKSFTIAIIIFMVLDCVLTMVALMSFMVRMIKTNNIEVDNAEQIDKIYGIIYDNQNISDIIYKFFGDEKMIKTFPRLKIEDSKGKIIFFSELLPDITPYYYKLNFEKSFDYNIEMF